MPTTTLLPQGTVDAGMDWSAVGGASFELALQSNDGATSYVTCAISLPEVLELTMSDLPPLAGAIQSVTVRISSRGLVASSRLSVFARLGGVDGPVAAVVPSSAGFVATSAAVLRPGGGIWAPGDLNAATLVIVNNTGGGVSTDVSFLALDVVWVPTLSLKANQSGQNIDRGYLTARAGWARGDASRAAFAPTATQGTTVAAGLAPGSAGGYYDWRRRYLPATSWTALLPPGSQR